MPDLIPSFIENEQVYPFDVDKTLVSVRRTSPLPGDIKLINPYTSQTVYVRPHEGHIDLLKEMHGRGRFIVLWSASGAKWALAVRDALGLGPYVHITMTKPIGYIDDMPAQNWMGTRIYLEPEDRT